MKVEITFCKMYEPGEDAPPQFQDEGPVQHYEFEAIPRYKDQILFNGYKYFVLDVIYDLDRSKASNNGPRVLIKAVRRVKHQWELKG
jgi:hypothetical protein